jgi:hypothetical protein
MNKLRQQQLALIIMIVIIVILFMLTSYESEVIEMISRVVGIYLLFSTVPKWVSKQKELVNWLKTFE